VLEVDDLHVDFPTTRGNVHAVRGVSFRVQPGEVVGLVGESGSGKSATASALLGLLPAPGRIVAGEITWKGESLLTPKRMARARGREIGLVPQEPMRSLNPLAKVGKQIEEVLRLHRGLDRPSAKRAAIELLGSVGISAPTRRARQYAHELSGGMCQRVLVALALAGDPELIVADEPTTALDVTIQAQIVRLLRGLRDDRGLSVIFITHDLGLVAAICDSVMVMYSGLIVESGPVRDVFEQPQHPYTAALLASRPEVNTTLNRLPAIPGSPPDPVSPPPGCPFYARCTFQHDARCGTEVPPLRMTTPGHYARSFYQLGRHEPLRAALNGRTAESL
jgi:peptide/nickel transport system ATP-binding protein